MLTTLLYTLGRFRGQVIGWGAALALLAMYMVPFYDTLAKQQAQLEQVLKGYPPELMAFFGDMSQMFTPQGYLTVEFFSYMPLILGIFAILAGAGLIARDEENGTLDLVLAYPVSRTALFVGRLLAFVAATALILLLIWLGFVITMSSSSLAIGWVQMAWPIFSLAGVLLFFATLALLLSMVLPSSRLAAMVAGIVLVASFFITSLARVDKHLESLAALSPLNYYQSGNAILGLNGSWLAGLLGFSLLFTIVAWWQFERRDIRVGGEGGWRLPALRRRATVNKVSLA
ncbi:MAG: hypothetical protein EXR62_18170 [Chloroflexi bacterium]|nr:hypothetical protein [Chloroflexota bacterium]